VDAALDALGPGLSGVETDSSIFRPATYIENSIGNLSETLLIGMVLLIVMLTAFVFRWRAVAISVTAILVSIMAAVLVLSLRGTTINAMVLAGLVLALAVLVDDAIVDRETIRRLLAQHRSEGSGRSTARIILEGSLEVRSPVAYATLIIALALLPVFALSGESGAFLSPLALSYATAVLVSMVVALTVTPALALLLLPKARPERGEPRLLRSLRRGYGRLLPSFIDAPRRMYLALAVAMLIGLAVLPFLDRGRSLIPTLKDQDLLIRWDGTPGTSLTEMNRITARASRELRALPGIRNVGAHVGRAVMSDQVVGINSSELWVSIDPTADYDATLSSIQEVVDGYPGLDRAVLTYRQERIGEVLTKTDEDITVRIYGQDLAVLRSKGEEVRRALSEIDGIVDPQVQVQTDEPTLEVKVDLAAAQRHGVKPGDVRRAAAVLLSGVEVGSLFEEQKVFEVVVWGAPQTRRSLTDVRELLLDTPSGGHVRLGDVAELKLAPNPNVIQHEATSRSVDVGAGVRGRSLASVTADVEDRLDRVEFPIEHHAELLRDYAERQAGTRRLIGVAVAAALGIFLLLQAAFASWRLAFVVFLVLPAALVGGIPGVFADGGVASIGSLVGFFAVLAIAVRNSIVAINHCQRLEQHEGEAFGRGLVLRAAQERIGPVLMTAATTGAVLLPLVLAGDIPGHEIVHPMAVVTLGGLVTSTLLALFVVPALYLRFGSRPRHRRTRSQSSMATDLANLDGEAEAEAGLSAKDLHG
ncbi:MAG: efflux RND transporter permease subunit, partial [Actinomycetota bacterium]